MKFVKISLVLLALAFCMSAMAGTGTGIYKTAVFQTGNKVINGVVDTSYNMDFTCLKASKSGSHLSNYANQAMIGYDPGAGTSPTLATHGANGNEDSGGTYILARFPIDGLRGKVNYIHSGRVTLWAVAQTSAPGDTSFGQCLPKRFGLKWNKAVADGNMNKSVNLFYVNPAVTTQCASWGDCDPTTDSPNIMTDPGATWKDYGDTTSKIWDGGWGPFGETNAPPYKGVAGKYGGIYSAAIDTTTLIPQAAVGGCLDLDQKDSVVLQFAIPQLKLEKWLHPEKFDNEVNAGFGLVWIRTGSAYGYGAAGDGHEGFFFVDDTVDEGNVDSYGLASSRVAGADNTYRYHIPATVGDNEPFATKAHRPKLEVIYEEGTFVPVELSSFDVE